MPILWSMSTTVRNSNRIKNFLKALSTIEEFTWNEDTQIRYQVLLIQYGFYHPNYIPSRLQLKKNLTYEEAKEIFDLQNYTDPPMRGRQSLNPLKKLNLVEMDSNNRIKITASGRNILNGTLGLEEPLIEWRFSGDDENIKPYVATLHFINNINLKLNNTYGITQEEFGFFVMTLYHYKLIKKHIDCLLNARNDNVFKNKFMEDIENNYSNYYDYNDYLDNNLRYLKKSDLLVVNQTINLNYNRIQDINYILSTDDARAF